MPQAGYAVLVGGVAAHLHGREGASGVGHLAEQTVERHGVGRGVFGRHGLLVDDIGHGGYESGLVSHQARHLIEEGGGGGLAVGARHAHEGEGFRRVVVVS